MRVIVDESAWKDIDEITSWIAKDNVEAARRMVDKILHATLQLGRFPRLSRPGRAQGTFEKIVAGTSYIVVFQIWEKPSAVVIAGVVHGSRNR